MDIVNQILEYSGYHYFHRGKYITRISKLDARYTMLSKIPHIVKSTLPKRSFTMLRFREEHDKWYVLTKEIYSSSINYSITVKIYPMVISEKNEYKIKKLGFGCLSSGTGDIRLPYETKTTV